MHKNHVGVELKDDAEPVVKGNKIHHQKMGGVWVYKESKGTFEGNEIYANGKAAFRVYEWGDPTVTGNRIHGGKAGGLLVYEMGAGTFVDNEICGNKTWNVEIKRHATTVLRGNRIHGGGLGGVSIHGEPDDPEGGMLDVDAHRRGT